MTRRFARANAAQAISICLCRRKAIARIANGFDGCVRTELLAQPADADFDDVGARIEVVTPDLGEQALAADHFAGVESEMVEQPEFPRRQLRRAVVDPRLMTCEIEHEPSDPLHVAVAVAAVRGSPVDLDADAREQLVEGKRLRQGVARAELEAAQLRAEIRPRREDEHRQVRSPLVQGLQDAESVATRQEEIEDDEVVLVLQRASQSALAVSALVDGESLRSEPPGEKGSDARFVLDQQDPHLPRRRRYALRK